MATLEPAARRRLPAALQRADVAAYRWVARRHAPAFDAVLPPLSRAANHSVLWMGVAAALAAGGGRFGRRAAARGMVVLGMTSAVVNLPAKFAARRARPVIDIVPEVRRLARLPTSTSFPSGHSASAAAFATAASLERPVLAAPLAVLAGGVAFSRVYTGVHYPGDVLAGVAMGAGIAWASRGLWPVTPPPAQQEIPPEARLADAPLPEGEGLVVVANPAAGPALAGDPVAEVRRRLPAAQIREVGEDDDLTEVLHRSVADAAALGVAGGDGSVNAAAAVAQDAGVSLAVVPAGTLNHLARDLGIGTVADVAGAVERGERIAADVGTIDGIPFCNSVCIGAYPDLVDARERLRPRVGEWLALVLGLVESLRGARPVRLEIDGLEQTVWLVFIGNCRYEGQGVAPAWRRRLDDGVLDVRTVDAGRPWARVRLFFAVITGTLDRSPVYRRRLAREVRVRSLQGPLRVTRDGEAFDCPAAFTIEKFPEPLTVYAPHR
ncbi:MAG TPA: phosphatase PAP2 family protein [Egibacteraceae bacterium]|nr:phosphatase PAP2 family protein [Egibacteraceae bacterium]